MAGERILIVEDEPKIARFLELELVHEGYGVQVAHDGRSGLAQMLTDGVDLMILDVMLPGLNGMEVLRRLRQESNVPVIMLTAKDGVTDKVMGLDSGADDYLTKPFAIEELLARIRTALKRSRAGSGLAGQVIVGQLVIDLQKHSVAFDGQAVVLTKREFDLLHYLAVNCNIALTRQQILADVWGYAYAGDTNIVDVYIRYLRSKLDDCHNVQLIHTVRGLGYVLKDG